MKYEGGCHCQRVRFEVQAPPEFKTLACNCSICAMTGFLHLIVPAQDFKLLTDDSCLETYTFNTHTAKHFFCRHCGVKSFYRPRSHPEGISVNVRCLDGMAERRADELFDGANWEANASQFQPLEPGCDSK